MIVQFDNPDLESIFQGIKPKRKPVINEVIAGKFIKTVKLLKYIENIPKLSQYAGLNFEALKGAYKGKYSVRLDQRYRIILRIQKDKIFVEEILVIEELTDHYKRIL